MFKLFRLATLLHLCMTVLNMWFFPPWKSPIPPAAEMRELQKGDDDENPDESQM